MPGKVKELPYEERKAIAVEMMISGKMIKQIAADRNIKLRYAYTIFNEFLEWRVGWKEKKEKS